MSRITAVLSMLHEGAEKNSATRLFRSQPVLSWTLHRLGMASGITNTAVLCWEDQYPLVQIIARQHKVDTLAKGPRQAIPAMDAVTVSRRWADGWRGGLLGTCEFDRGYYGPWIKEVVEQLPCDGILLVDPSAGLVDPPMIDSLLKHAEDRPHLDMIFSPAAPGLSGVLLRPVMLEQLSGKNLHPGRLLHYHPDHPIRDPLAGEECAPIPTPLARTTHRFTLDTQRQIERISGATAKLNGQLIASSGLQLLEQMNSSSVCDEWPRDVVLELNTIRSTRPIYTPFSHVNRGDLPLPLAEKILTELSSAEDIRLTLGGVGDSLLSENFFSVLEMADRLGIAVHVMTDLAGVDPTKVQKLAESRADIVSVMLPSVTPAVYQAVMGVDLFGGAIENIRTFVAIRKGRCNPILVPHFVKCQQNIWEMEAWYDQWIRAVGCAVISGPSDYAGLIADCAVADMTPPIRKPCARLSSRMTILSDGRMVSCEQDVMGKQVLGVAGQESIREAWQTKIQILRTDHAAGEWNRHGLCGKCREWWRP